MNFNVWIALIVAVVTATIAALAVYRDPRSFMHRVFAVGMILFTLDAGFGGLAYMGTSPDEFLSWRRFQFMVASFVPAVWLLFSVSFARTNYREQSAKWKWFLIPAFAVPIVLTTLFRNSFFEEPPLLLGSSALFLRIGWAGFYWHLLWIILSILILMNLERTFRHVTGRIRWQTKFMFLGIGAIFSVLLFTHSQAILFKGINTGLDILNMGALLVGNMLVLGSFFRGKPLKASVHVSHAVLYSSLTMLIVGTFFMAVGLLAWLSIKFEWISNINILIFLVFLAMIATAVFLLSDRLRMKRKRFISRHFKRSHYDYQKMWESFTSRTTSVMQIRDLCNVIVRIVSETLEILSVTIWLVDERKETLSLGSSTVLSEQQIAGATLFKKEGAALIRAMLDKTTPIDLDGREDDWVSDLQQVYGLEGTEKSDIRYCVPMNAAGHLIGIMTLSEKVFSEPLSFEEVELVEIIANQAAAGLLNLRLSEQLRQAQEMEAFQSMSAFFIHDLKNLASKLSLVTQNLPVHLDNPEFREDALLTISQCVAKINSMSNRLSILSQKLELSLKQGDLNEVVAATISDVAGYVQAPVILNAEAVPTVTFDREQIHKVVENLLINAADALGVSGQNWHTQSSGTPPRHTAGFPQQRSDSKNPDPFSAISVSTHHSENWAEISVHDNGCGMSREFIEKSLFRPFQTTKKTGMGIGLYHCKTIVEAHGGRIEVESEEGRGTTFTIFLPV